eukprot:scaffold5931_cov410-Prasinococcus_capsulatus_cf.AAC.3
MASAQAPPRRRSSRSAIPPVAAVTCIDRVGGRLGDISGWIGRGAWIRALRRAARHQLRHESARVPPRSAPMRPAGAWTFSAVGPSGWAFGT